MNECVRCGHTLPIRGSQKHVCKPAAPQIGCADTESDEARQLCELEQANAIAEAVGHFEDGWTLDLAITLAMKRVHDAAYAHGWFRGHRIGRAYSKSPNPVSSEGESSDECNTVPAV